MSTTFVKDYSYYYILFYLIDEFGNRILADDLNFLGVTDKSYNPPENFIDCSATVKPPIVNYSTIIKDNIVKKI